jgi:hypothetical protein
MKSNKLQYL